MKLLCLFLTFLVIFSCEPRKNTEYVIIINEARRLQSALRVGKIIDANSWEDLLREVSDDGIVRWKLADDKKFVYQTIKKYSIKATSSETTYYYIGKNGDIVPRK